MMIGAAIIIAVFKYLITRLIDRRSRKSPEELSEDICTQPEKYHKDFEFLKNLPDTSITRTVFKYWLEEILSKEESDVEFRADNDGSECLIVKNAKYYVFTEGNPPRVLLCDALKIPVENRWLADEILQQTDLLPSGAEYQRNDMNDNSTVISISLPVVIDTTEERSQNTIDTAIDKARQLQLELIRRYNRLKLQPRP